MIRTIAVWLLLVGAASGAGRWRARYTCTARSCAPVASVKVETKTETKVTTETKEGKPEATTESSALVELNQIRMRRGLLPFRHDERLARLALRKALAQASVGRMGHGPGWRLGMGGARWEGVGSGSSFRTCYMWTRGARTVGAATAIGRNGRRYHALLLR